MMAYVGAEHANARRPHNLSDTRPAVEQISQSVPRLAEPTAASQTTILVPPLGQFVIGTLLQIAGFAAAIAFGIFAVQSVAVARKATDEAAAFADAANKLALLTLCLSSDDLALDMSSTCSYVLRAAGNSLPQLATSLFPSQSGLPTPSPTSSPTSLSSISSTKSSTSSPPPLSSPTWLTSRATSSTSTSTSLPTSPISASPSGAPGSGIIIGAVFGGVAILVVITVCTCLCLRRRGIRVPCVRFSKEKKQYNFTRAFRVLFMETKLLRKDE